MATRIWRGEPHEHAPVGQSISYRISYNLASAIPEYHVFPILIVKWAANASSDSRIREKQIPLLTFTPLHGVRNSWAVSWETSYSMWLLLLLFSLEWSSLKESHDPHQLDLSSEYLLDSKDLSQGGFHELWPWYPVTFFSMIVFNYFHSTYHSKIMPLLDYFLQPSHN